MVTMQQSWTISPTSPTSSQSLFLSCFDLRMWHFPFVRRLLFYPAQGETPPFPSLVEKLKSSLRDALVHFYPFAGRLTEIDDSENGARPSLICDDAGIPFVTAEADSSLDTLLPEFQTNNDLFDSLVAAPDAEGDHTTYHKLPLLSIQVTRFKCGGIALGLAFNHVVADGTGFWTFVKCWAEIARNEPQLCPPLHDRTLLHPSTSPGLKTLCDAILPGKSDIAERFKFLSTTEVKNGGGMVPKSRLKLIPPTQETYFCFSPEGLSQLKADVLRVSQMGHDSPSWFTTYEVVCALFWRCITRARDVAGGEEAPMIIPAGCRDRLPFLPQNYFGNAAYNVVATATAQELLTSPVSFAATVIHQAISKGIRSEVIADFIQQSEQHDAFSNAIVSRNGAAAMGSNKLPCLGCDFGWGKPACVRQVTQNFPFVLVLNPGMLGPGSVDASLRLFPHQMDRLHKDPELLRYWRGIR